MWSEDRDEYFTTSPTGGGGVVATGAKTHTTKHKNTAIRNYALLCKALLNKSFFLACAIPHAFFSLSLLPNFLTGVSLFTGTPGAFLRGKLSLPDWTWKSHTERTESLHTRLCRHFVSCDLVVLRTKSEQRKGKKKDIALYFVNAALFFCDRL